MSNNGYPATSLVCEYDEEAMQKLNEHLERMYKNLWKNLLERCPLSKETVLAISNVSYSYFSVARYSGGIIYQGKHYIYEPTIDALIRSDVYKWAKREMLKSPNTKDNTPNLFTTNE